MKIEFRLGALLGGAALLSGIAAPLPAAADPQAVTTAPITIVAPLPPGRPIAITTAAISIKAPAAAGGFTNITTTAITIVGP